MFVQDVCRYFLNPCRSFSTIQQKKRGNLHLFIVACVKHFGFSGMYDQECVNECILKCNTTFSRSGGCRKEGRIGFSSLPEVIRGFGSLNPPKRDTVVVSVV